MEQRLPGGGQIFFRVSLASLTASLSILALGSSAQAQIRPDNTLGAESSTVLDGCVVCFIDGGATRGSNLFHSFEEFSVSTGGAAFFNNAIEIQNILSRVTGSSVSSIDGLVAANGTANLFLLNPNGVVFGPNASLQVGGAFLATTADGLNFEDGFEFSASNPQAPPLLTINAPIGLTFRGSPQPITNQSVFGFSPLTGELGLEVLPGRTLALVGGDVSLINGGQLTAPEGRIELGGITSEGTVGISVIGDTVALDFSNVDQLSDVNLLDGSVATVLGQGGGDIVVNADTFFATNGSGFSAGTFGAGDGGDIILNATTVNFFGVGSTGFGSAAFNVAQQGSSGDAGDIIVNAQTVMLDGNRDFQLTSEDLGFETGFQSQTAPNAPGDAGNIIINTETFSAMSNAGARSLSFPDSGGGTGNVIINAELVNLPTLGFVEAVTQSEQSTGAVRVNSDRLFVGDGSTISTSTFSGGNAGPVNINVVEQIEVVGINQELGAPSNLQSVTSGSGNGGVVRITSPVLRIVDGASVSAGTTASGTAGNLIINASELVELEGTSPLLLGGVNAEQGSLISAQSAGGSGSAGRISINTDTLRVLDGGSITAATGQVGATGDAGGIKIQASTVEIVGESEPGRETSLASSITASTSNTGGNAGNIRVDTNRLIVGDGALLAAGTNSTSGDAGSVTVRADERVTVRGTNSSLTMPSSISALVGSEAMADGGNIVLITPELNVEDGGQVSTGILGSGNAGSVIIQASNVTVSGAEAELPSAIRADVDESAIGIGGTIDIESNQFTVSDFAFVSVASDSLNGEPGNINVVANDINIERLGFLTADSETGTGGNIELAATNILLQTGGFISAAGSPVDITTEGNVDISAETLVLLDTSRIITSALDPEGGSNIAISPLDGEDLIVLVSPDSLINAEGELIIAEELEADPPEVPELEVVDPAEQIAQNACTQGEGSEFVVTGRGGLPANPIDVISGDATQVELVAPASSDTQSGASQPQGEAIVATTPDNSNVIVPAQGWILNQEGKVVLTAQNPTSLRTGRSPHTALCSPR